MSSPPQSPAQSEASSGISLYNKEDDFEIERSLSLWDQTLQFLFMLIFQQQQQLEGSRRAPGYTCRYCDRRREEQAQNLVDDYFCDNSVFQEKFRRRFRMARPLFERVVAGVTEQDAYFIQRPDALGHQGLSTLQKCTAAIQILAYGVRADAVDEYCRIGESTTMECFQRFCDAVVAKFGTTYMRRANEEDIQRLLRINAVSGFPGMLGSIDCMHWKWKNCPKAWKGKFQGRTKHPTLVLEAVASQDTWLWHSFFGFSGKHNDLTILHCSPVFDDLLNSTMPPVNGHQYNMVYYLTDGIYPSWATFVKSYKNPITHKQAKFAAA